MAEFTIKKWRCDRCGAVYDKRPVVTPRAQLFAEYDWPEGPGTKIAWKELCTPCNKKIETLTDILVKEVKELSV